MKCPKCEQARLKKIKVNELEVDHCDECGGVWCDQSELAQLLELKPAELKQLRRGSAHAGANQARGNCPRCGTVMVRVASAQQRRVTLDKCPDCDGAWLDGGELRALLSGDE